MRKHLLHKMIFIKPRWPKMPLFSKLGNLKKLMLINMKIMKVNLQFNKRKNINK